MDVTLVTVRTPRVEMRVPSLLVKMLNMIQMVRLWEM
jgi:hypothetical protein